MGIAFVFPGQGSQFVGMGKDLYESDERARRLMEQANEILGYDVLKIMFEGDEETLKQTRHTQPAIFLHSIASLQGIDESPDAVAGHSLGEFSALVAAGVLPFEDGLRLVQIRAEAMDEACQMAPTTMAAIIGLEDEAVEEICDIASKEVGETVVPANYNAPGQLVISGHVKAVEKAVELAKEQGARKAVVLAVSGAFHSPFMEPARQKLASAIEKLTFNKPKVPVYQNVTAQPETDPDRIKENLIIQLTNPVRWKQTILNMKSNGIDEFREVGPGKVLTGLIRRILR
ncbi:MAG: ACP S-malonyltransferase [Chlorobi bacterium]|nr:ACP S-malonyltransferase [Chlorobiota bacterium]